MTTDRACAGVYEDLSGPAIEEALAALFGGAATFARLLVPDERPQIAEALRPEFKDYAKAVVANAHILAETLVGGGLAIVSGGTDSHLMLVDLRPKRLTGRAAI